MVVSEIIFGTGSKSRTVLPQATAVAGGKELRFSRSFAATDLRITVLRSAELDWNWQDVAVSDGGDGFVSLMSGVTVTEGAGEAVRAVVVEMEDSGVVRQFVRLRVVLVSGSGE